MALRPRYDNNTQSIYFIVLNKLNILLNDFFVFTAIKAKNVVTLSVDNVFVEPGIGVAGVSSTDTNNPLFIGGHPNPSKPRGIKTQEQFVGCIRNLNINRSLYRFGASQAIGSVTATTCPTI